MVTTEQVREIEAQHDRPEDVAEAVQKAVGRRASAGDLRAAASKLSTEELRFAVMERADQLATLTQSQGFADPTKLEDGKQLTKEEFDALLDNATDAAMAQFGNLPEVSKGAVQIDTFRMAATASGTYTNVHKVKESSGTRYCLAALARRKAQELGEDHDLRPVRFDMVMPPTKLTRTTIEKLGPEGAKLAELIPMPSQRRAAKLADQNALRGWQISKIEQAMQTVCTQTGRIPVFVDPESRIGNTGFSSCSVLLIDEQEARRFTENVGEIHYASGFVSGGGTRPGSNDPDYREYGYVALRPEEVAPLTELLGHGTFKEGTIGDGRSPLLLPEWPEEAHDALEFQFRAITGYDDQPKTGRPSLSKGMTRPYHPEALRQALWYYNEQMDEEEQERHAQAAEIIQNVMDAGQPLMVLVRGDQMKIGGDTTPTYGRALVCATYLTGHHETEIVERIQRDEDAAHYGETQNVRVPKPQYEISMNSQLFQLGSPEALELLEEHLKIEATIVKEKTKTIRGAAEIASDKTEQRIQNMEQLEDGGSLFDENYRVGADQLTDALTGGGVRMKGKDWVKALKGQTGTLQMLPSTRSRFDKAVNAYIRRYLYRGMGGYGFGFHHATVEDSTGLLWNIWGNWEGISSKETYLKQCREGCAQIKTPLADRSAVAIPRKVTDLMNADDDGDITISIAAHMEIPGYDGMVTVILSWRYPCVDVPILWVVPKEMPCPFLGRDQEERERFERLIRIFGPEIKDTAMGPDGGQVPNPAVYDDGITRASATNAYRLLGKGAKSGDKQKRNAPLTQDSALRLIRAKRELNTTGTLTRDLERIGDILRRLAQRHAETLANGQKAAAKAFRKEFDTMHRRGAGCAQSIEANLTAFKYKQQADVRAPDLTVEMLEWHDEKEVRQQLLPLDYHRVIDHVVATTDGHHRVTWDTPDWETNFEEWNGPSCPSDHGSMLRRLVQNEIQDIVASIKNIETDRQPFLDAIRRRLKRWKKRLKAELPEAEWRPLMEEVVQEGQYVQRLCSFYRGFWRELLGDKLKRMQEEAEDKEAAARKAEKITARAGRHLHLVMHSASQGVSAEGLAYGVYHDWKPTRNRDGTMRENSLAAGMALITGRNGEVFYRSTTSEHAPLEGKDTKHVVVWRTGKALPVSAYGESRTVSHIGVDNDNQVIALRLAETETEEAEDLSVNFGEHAKVPGRFPEDVTVKLARTSDQQGVLYWRHE